MRRLSQVLALAALSWFAVACSGGGSKSPGPSASAGAGSKPAFSGTVTVFAAASLTDAFNEVATVFKAASPGVTVSFNFAGTPTLRTQLEQGARADVFASADTVQMANALKSGVVTDQGRVFVRNSLVIITPADATPKVAQPGDLAKPGIKLILANRDVPVGSYAHQMLASMAKDQSYGTGFSDRALKNLVSEESDVKQVVAKVQLGEADAGVVYGTDVTPALAPKLKAIKVPDQFNVIAEYPIAMVKDAGNAPAARGFIDFVFSPAGQAILKKYGFQTASG